MKNTIMIHSLFRAGSTYFFNKFRQNHNFWCYYEPLHHDIAKLKPDALEIWKFDETSTSNMNHPSLDKPHFYEYKAVFDEKHIGIPYFDDVISYNEFTKVRSVETTYKYINNLIVKSPKDTIPILQFNRTGMRLQWFKKEFNEAMHLFLLRNPRDQFESYLGRGPLNKNWFLAINLFIYLINKNDFKKISLNSKIYQLDLTSDDVIQNLTTCLDELSSISIELHYEIFLHMWLLSYIAADHHTDLIIDMDKMNESNEYKNEVIQLLKKYDPRATLNFDDFRIKHYSKFSISLSQYQSVEKKVIELYSDQISDELKERIEKSISNNLCETSSTTWSQKIHLLKIRIFGK